MGLRDKVFTTHDSRGYLSSFYILYSSNILSRDSRVGIALGYGLDDRVLGFDSRRGLGIFPFTTAVSRTALGPTQPPIQWVPGTLSLGVKRPGREAVHSPPSSAEVKECVELYLHSPNTPSWRGAQLKNGDNFTFTSYMCQQYGKKKELSPSSTTLNCPANTT
jgi:hypothetical protein